MKGVNDNLKFLTISRAKRLYEYGYLGVADYDKFENDDVEKLFYKCVEFNKISKEIDALIKQL